MARRRIEVRMERREDRFTAAMNTAPTGQEKADLGWDWVRIEMAVLARLNPVKADKAWRDLADSLAQVAKEAAKEADSEDRVPVH
ncbi:hypothetical protein ACQP1V_42875 (plasmid) [Microtetraspora malaysiensis]|uniref:hypothetical protein n=1 Tax=Microtetraspora malaysiensis TaxID=161358 RepID=UPI003D8AA687